MDQFAETASDPGVLDGICCHLPNRAMVHDQVLGRVAAGDAEPLVLELTAFRMRPR
jgi:hypothetical protein